MSKLLDTSAATTTSTDAVAKQGSALVGVKSWWVKQALWEKALIILIAFLLVELIFIGRPMILEGQGDSMKGPRGLRDGAREVCIPIRWWPVIPGWIYAFLDPDDNLCLKRASTADKNGEVFFLGDNQGVGRDGQPESIDSRSFGKISRDRIKAVRIATLPRWMDGKPVWVWFDEANKIDPRRLEKADRIAEELAAKRELVLNEYRKAGLIEVGPWAVRDAYEATGCLINRDKPLLIVSPVSFGSIRYTFIASGEVYSPTLPPRYPDVFIVVDGKKVPVSVGLNGLCAGVLHRRGKSAEVRTSGYADVKELMLFR